MKIGNLEVYGIIYKITNKVNGKIYIGQTTRKNGFNGRYAHGGKGIERVYNHSLYEKQRIEEGKRGNYNVYLFRSIEKYGFDAFEVCEIFDVAFSREELDTKEICWIAYYNSADKKFGYNNAIGGKSANGRKMSKKEKEHLRQLFTGRKISEETKKKISKARKESNKGKKRVICLNNGEVYNSAVEVVGTFSISSSTSISSCCLHKLCACGIEVTGFPCQWLFYEDYLTMTKEELFNIILDNQLGRDKMVYCIELDKFFLSTQKCADYLGRKSRKAITNCCNGRLETSGGYHWKYVENLTEQEYINYDIENKLRNFLIPNFKVLQ